MKQLRIVLWVMVAIAGAFLIIKTQGQTDRNKLRSSGDDLGGEYTLTAHTGERIFSKNFNGQYQLIYFGYSFCPDVCPVELQKMSQAVTLLEEDGHDISKIQPVFITVDPRRDTVEELSKYMTGFHESFIAFTGSEEEIGKVAKDYKIFYQKGQSEDDGFYLMNHSNVIILMGTDGKFLKFFTAQNTPREIANTMKILID